MDLYWEETWRNPDLQEYRCYINRHINSKREFIELFTRNNVKSICDAACGFGAYSAMLAAKGFMTAGFDVSINSIKLTKELLRPFYINTQNYIVSNITNIKFSSGRFDAVTAHAVIDHLSVADAEKALEELLRIVKNGGLVYLSFDGLEEGDLILEHQVLEDGSFLYTDESRKGLLFKYYKDSDIDELLNGRSVIFRKTNKAGEREIIIQK